MRQFPLPQAYPRCTAQKILAQWGMHFENLGMTEGEAGGFRPGACQGAEISVFLLTSAGKSDIVGRVETTSPMVSGSPAAHLCRAPAEPGTRRGRGRVPVAALPREPLSAEKGRGPGGGIHLGAGGPTAIRPVGSLRERPLPRRSALRHFVRPPPRGGGKYRGGTAYRPGYPASSPSVPRDRGFLRPIFEKRSD